MAELTEFAKNLRRIREERKLTQSALAEMIGVTPQTISAYEKGNGEKGNQNSYWRIEPGNPAVQPDVHFPERIHSVDEDSL